MTLITRARNRKIEIDAPADLADATGVRITIDPVVPQQQAPAPEDPWAVDPLADVIGAGEGPPDLAEISFVDLTSMVVMQDEGVVDVFTGDRHFEQVGLGFRLHPEIA